MRTTIHVVIVCLVLTTLTLSGYGQFQILETRLTPPGPPQDDIMKTLDQVEPRIAINTSNTAGDSSSKYAIYLSGSYYLTENLWGQPAEIGLRVYASDVSIDLNGYSLIGSTNSSPNNASGIVVDTNAASVVIHNGSVTLWAGGIISHGSNITVRNIRCSKNNLDGVRMGPLSQVYDSSFVDNANDGVELGANSRVSGVLAHNNNYGIVVGPGSQVQNSVSRDNTNHGIRLHGTGCRVSSCITRDNNIGISIDADRCTVVNNTSLSNTSEGIASGILGNTEYRDCLIDGNHVAGNGSRGILITGSDNVIVRNVSLGNGSAYVILASNVVGRVISAIDTIGVSGSSGGNLDATVGPWSNLAR